MDYRMYSTDHYPLLRSIETKGRSQSENIIITDITLYQLGTDGSILSSTTLQAKPGTALRLTQLSSTP